MPDVIAAYEQNRGDGRSGHGRQLLREADERVAMQAVRGHVSRSAHGPQRPGRAHLAHQPNRHGACRPATSSTRLGVDAQIYGALTEGPSPTATSLPSQGGRLVANVQTAASNPRLAESDPLHWLWHALTSSALRWQSSPSASIFAAGRAHSQTPLEIRGSPAAVEAWLQFQHGKFGFMTSPHGPAGPVRRVSLAVVRLRPQAALVASVCVCTANRLPPIWRNATGPRICACQTSTTSAASRR